MIRSLLVLLYICISLIILVIDVMGYIKVSTAINGVIANSITFIICLYLYEINKIKEIDIE